MVIRSIKTIMRRWRRREDGQAIVEFALVAPIFLLLVLGVVEFGRAFNVYQTVTDAAREGARTAVIANPTFTLDTVAARINANLNGAALDTASAIKTVTGFHTGTGTPLTVSISYPYHLGWLQPFMSWTNAQASFNMNAVITFRNE